jgi:hypothetical protein
MAYSPKHELMIRIGMAAAITSSLAFAAPALAAEPSDSGQAASAVTADSAVTLETGAKTSTTSVDVQEKEQASVSNEGEASSGKVSAETASDGKGLKDSGEAADSAPTSPSGSSEGADEQQEPEEAGKKETESEPAQNSAAAAEPQASPEANTADSAQTTYSVEAVSDLASTSAAAAPAQYSVLLASSTAAEKTVLDGIDVSYYQKDIDISNISADFVIVKVSEGTSYLSPKYKAQADETLASGKLLGLYHFARTGTTALEQAKYFVDHIQNYLGKAVLFLDWENTSYSDIKAQSRILCVSHGLYASG